jgi:WD40 repeat protein
MLIRRRGNNADSPLAERLHTAAHSRSCFALSWSPGGLPETDGGLGLLASGGGDGKIIVWQVVRPTSTSEGAAEKVQEGVQLYPIAAMRDSHGVSDVNSLAWCLRGDGKGRGMLASCGDDGSVKVWRVIRD